MPEGPNIFRMLAEAETERRRKQNALLQALVPSTSPPSPFNALNALSPPPAVPSTHPTSGTNPLAGDLGLPSLFSPPLPPRNALLELRSKAPALPASSGRLSFVDALPPRPRALPDTRRHVFYSFHYDDVVRVNNVRHAEQFKAKVKEVPQSYYDRSLWESSKRTDPNSLKALIREGIKGTSVVCVLVGTDTWSRPWVRYEIARSVVDGKGLLAVDLNSITHNRDRCAHPLGQNPLAHMAVGKVSDGTYRLFERQLRVINGRQQEGWWALRGLHMGCIAPEISSSASYRICVQPRQRHLSLRRSDGRCLEAYADVAQHGGVAGRAAIGATIGREEAWKH